MENVGPSGARTRPDAVVVPTRREPGPVLERCLRLAAALERCGQIPSGSVIVFLRLWRQDLRGLGERSRGPPGAQPVGGALTVLGLPGPRVLCLPGTRGHRGTRGPAIRSGREPGEALTASRA